MSTSQLVTSLSPVREKGHQPGKIGQRTGDNDRLAFRGDASRLTEYLHVDAVGILDVQARIWVLQWSNPMLGEVARGGFTVETRHPDREVIHNSGGALTIERHERPAVAEADDPERLVLAHHRETEHLLVEVNGTLQVRDLNTDMVDVSAFEIEALLGRRGRSARSQQREALNEVPAAQRAFLKTGQQIGNDRLHGSFLSLESLGGAGS
jgi:hypothetical protein